MVAVHFVALSNGEELPILCWEPFSQWILDKISFFNNPTDTITNSSLKLSGVITHKNFLAQAVIVPEKMTHNCSNSNALVDWQ